jgi:hypothetical protein
MARETPLVLHNGSMPVDLEVLTEELWSDLDGMVDRHTIRQVLAEVAPAYRDARITTFVAIFVRRDALERLRAQA